jgi:hypothetical protein
MYDYGHLDQTGEALYGDYTVQWLLVNKLDIDTCSNYEYRSDQIPKQTENGEKEK